MIGYLFAGQGSQYIGMGKDLKESFPQAEKIFTEASRVLGIDLGELCFSGNQDCLKKTDICQPAVLTVSIAAFEAFKATYGIRAGQAAYTAGLSLGEYSALVASEVLSFSDAIRVVRRRAELMNAAAVKYPGKMAAVIGLERDALKNICLASGKVDLANLNCPGQIVISGEPAGVDKAKESALQQGAKKVIELEVSGAFHSSLMLEAAMEFKGFLEGVELKDPVIPVVSNVDAKPADKAGRIRENLVKQIYSPVLWEDSMRFMAGEGLKRFFEFGPGRILKGLMRKIDPAAEVVSIEKKDDILSFKL